MALTPNHTHNESDPYGKEEEAHAPYAAMASLQSAAQSLLQLLINVAAELPGASETVNTASAAHDAVGDIKIGEPE